MYLVIVVEIQKVIPVVSEFWVDQYNDFVENYCQTYIKHLIEG